MAKTANIRTFAALEDQSGITSEREQLLLHTEGTEECRRRKSAANDGRSNQCQHCGRNTVIPTPKPSRYGQIESFSPWFPQADPENPQARTWIKKLSRRGTALFIQIFISTAVLVFNIFVMIYVAEKYGRSNGFGEIYQGDCNLVARYNTVVHLGINILSTLLLGSSNYCAQLLVAPTRSEIDRAHRKRDWLDIGVPSLRNLWKKRIARKRKAAWTLLMISSVLLHLFWNSAVFAARPFSSYQIVTVTSDYLADAGPWPTQNNQTLYMLRNTEKLFRLNKTQCIERYTDSTLAQKDVLVVAANLTMQDHASLMDGNTSSSLLYESPNVNDGPEWILGQSWLCSAYAAPVTETGIWCTADFLLAREADWTVMEFPWLNNTFPEVDKSIWVDVDYCLSAGVETLDSFCALRYSPEILLIVCLLNLGKCAVICYTAYLHHQYDKNSGEKASLVTVGDAAASFLVEEDATTENLSFASRDEFTRNKWPTKRSPWSHPGPSLSAIRWFRAASYTRWLVTLGLCVAVLVIVAVFLEKCIDGEKLHGITVDISSLAAQGLGTTQPYATGLIGLERHLNQLAGFYVATLFANIWQVILSLLYLFYNGLLTTMLVADEWNDFIKTRKTLRLSSPQGIQRSSYFLSLPYRFALPLMIASGTLHWLISQSIFVIQSIGMVYGTSFYHHPAYDSSLIGYSNIGIIYCIVLGSIMVIALISLGFFKSYRPRKRDGKQETDAQSYTMPLVSTCSAAISAACHRPDEDSKSHLLPVIWGFDEGDYWCLTSSREVSYPELGPRFKPEGPTEANDSKQNHPELNIDVGPAFEVLIRSQDGPTPDDAIIVEQGPEVNDTSALLRRLSADPQEAGYRSSDREEILPGSYMWPGT